MFSCDFVSSKNMFSVDNPRLNTNFIVYGELQESLQSTIVILGIFDEPNI